MSLVVAWYAIDTHSISSAYIASDSRVSWPDGSCYDSCRKTFFSENYPELIAYCGDVLFPSLLVSSVIESIDKGMIFEPNDNATKRYKKFKTFLFNEFHKYPKNKMGDAFELLYVNKEITTILYPNFYSYIISWNKRRGFKSKTIKTPSKSGTIHVMGSGAAEFYDKFDNFKEFNNKGTSRNIYQCFAHLMLGINDPHCGGAPQLVGMYRKPNTNGFSFGIIHNRRRYYNGLNIGNMIINNKLEWRNKFFEICSGKLKKRIPGSQIQENDLWK
jgi:hypothetical protein